MVTVPKWHLPNQQYNESPKSKKLLGLDSEISQSVATILIRNSME